MFPGAIVETSRQCLLGIATAIVIFNSIRGETRNLAPSLLVKWRNKSSGLSSIHNGTYKKDPRDTSNFTSLEDRIREQQMTWRSHPRLWKVTEIRIHIKNNELSGNIFRKFKWS